MDDKPRINKKARIQERKDNIRDYNAKNHTEIEIVSTPLATNNNNNNAFEGNASGSSSDSIIPNEFGTTKIPKGLLDAKAKSLKDFGDITDIDDEFKSMNDINGIKTESQNDDIMNDNNLSDFAKKKIKKYKILGKIIKKKSKNSELCIVTMPFPRNQYTWYEYLKIIECLSPKDIPIIFIRGNQDQVLTFAL